LYLKMIPTDIFAIAVFLSFWMIRLRTGVSSSR
jgi:hypothetical protein